VLRNLISNAIKFTKPGGEIILAVTKEKNKLTVQVKDNGIGIPNEDIDKLFRIDENFSTYGTANEAGTGLGLILCKEFIEKHNEEIWVVSDPDGKSGDKGTTFYFTLPYNTVSEEKKVVREQDKENQINPEVSGLKILIAEDDETSRNYISLIIKDFSAKILDARTGIETVELCRNTKDLDLILMDIRMPIMNGYDATREIRKFNKKVIIIAQTAFALSGDREKALEAGCDDYITKPIKRGELIKVIKKYFNKLMADSLF
jgi:CheY-like chemotaxis protein